MKHVRLDANMCTRIAFTALAVLVFTGMPTGAVHAVTLHWDLRAVAYGTFEGNGQPALDGSDVVSVAQGPEGRYFSTRAGGLIESGGVFVDQGRDGVRTIAKALDPLPDSVDETFARFINAASIDRGNVAFVGASAMADGIEERVGVYVRDSAGHLRQVVDSKTPLPQGGGNFTSNFGLGPSMSDNRVAFHNGGSGEPSEGVYVEEGGVIQRVAGAGTKVPFSQPLPGGYFVELFGMATTGPAIDGDLVTFGANGRVFRAPGDPGGFIVRGVYTVDVRSGVASVVADNATPVPGGSGATFTDFLFSPAIDGGDVAFGATRSDGVQGVYSSSDGVLNVVATGATPDPVGGGKLSVSASQWPSIDRGNIAFSASSAEGVPGIYLNVGGAVTKVTDLNEAAAVALASDRYDFFPSDAPSDFFTGPDLYHEALDGNAIAMQLGDGADLGAHLVATLKGFDYGDFSDTSYLMLNGAAAQEADRLRLTPDEPSTAGSAFFAVPFTIDSEQSLFSYFAFEIGGVNGGGDQGSDGFAFVIQADPAGAMAIGNGGEGLGFGINRTAPSPVSPIAPSVAIEFDTHQNAFDPNDNHVALIINGDVTNHFVFDLDAPLLNGGEPLFAWVLYSGSEELLKFFLSQRNVMPDSPMFEASLDLVSLLGPQVYFGFSAGTGGGFNYHDILEWQLAIEHPVLEPGSLALLGLGFAGLGLARRRRKCLRHDTWSPEREFI